MRMPAGLGAIVLVALLAAPLAQAHGDPAGDYLLGHSLFVPADDDVPNAYAAQLRATIARAKTHGYRIRIALIGTKYDMGTAAGLYEEPKRYARALGQDLSVDAATLLVVMPNGFGVAKEGKASPSEQAVVDRIAPPGPKGAALASAATRAVRRLAANAGAVFPVPPLGKAAGGPSTNRDRLEIAGITLVTVLLLSATGAVRRRRRRAR